MSPNNAVRYVVRRSVVARGDPQTVLAAELVMEVFDLPRMIIEGPVPKTPLVVPLGSTCSVANSGVVAAAGDVS